MHIIKFLFMKLFFLQYSLFLAISACFNLFKKFIGQLFHKNSDLSIHPYGNTHHLVFATTHQFASQEGYDFQIYQFVTEDGVGLSTWRIKLKNNTKSKPYPVFFLHGLIDCSASWLLQVDKNNSLPYMLASQGYDVWLGNNRGNRNSPIEVEEKDKYWSYNFDHLVEYDFPTFIDGILKETQKQKIIYVGHSQGSSQLIFGLGLRTNLMNKIACLIGLGTVVSFHHAHQNILINFFSKYHVLEVLDRIGLDKLLVLPWEISQAAGVMVGNSKLHFHIMLWFVRLICGFSEINKIPHSIFSLMVTHTPGGSSTKNLIHWIQCKRNKHMSRFDYGKIKNKELYGQQHPPVYGLDHLKKVKFNTYLFRGTKDTTMSEKDVQMFKQKFPQGRIKVSNLHDYHHLEYLWGKTAKEDLYDQIFDIIQKETKRS